MTQGYRPRQPQLSPAAASIPPPHVQPDAFIPPDLDFRDLRNTVASESPSAPVADIPLTQQDLDDFLAVEPDLASQDQAVGFIQPGPSWPGGYQQPQPGGLQPPQNAEPGHADYLDPHQSTYSSDVLNNSSTDIADFTYSRPVSESGQPLFLPFPNPDVMRTAANADKMHQPFITPPHSAPSDQHPARSGKRPRAESVAISSSADDSQSESHAHAKFFVDKQFRKLSHLAAYASLSVHDLLRWLTLHLQPPAEDQPRKRARTGSVSTSDVPRHGPHPTLHVDPDLEALLVKEAGKIRSLADTLDKPVPEVMRLLSTLDGERDQSIEAPSGPNEPALYQHEDANEAKSDETRFLEHAQRARHKSCRARTSTTNPDGILKCLRPECTGAYDKKKKSSWLRHVAQMVPDVLYGCPQADCPYIDIRQEWIVNHLQNKHGVSDREMAKQQAKQRPFRVPFSAQCGWCGWQSTDWQEFFGTHVYNHLTGEGDCVKTTKEQWDGPYPPLAPRTPPHRRPKPGCRDRLDVPKPGAKPDDDDDDDDDNDHSSFSPGPAQGYSGKSFYSQPGPSYQGQGSFPGYQNAPHTQSHNQAVAVSSSLLQDSGDFAPDALGDKSFLRIRQLKDPSERIRACSTPSVPVVPFGKAEPALLPFRHVRTLYQGVCSTVDAVQYPDTGLVLARKRVRSVNAQHGLSDLYRREVDAMLSLRHAHITKLVDYFMGEQTYTLILQPVADASLQQYLERPPPDYRESLLRWYGCLASAVDYLHLPEVGVCHQDIKPANVLIRDKRIHLADFGSSRRFREAHATSHRAPMTPMYTAPEVFQKTSRDASSDVFALGLVFLEMLTVMCHVHIGRFHDWMRAFVKKSMHYVGLLKRHTALWEWITSLQGSGSVHGQSCPGIRQSLENIKSMTSFDPEKRPSARTIASWLPHTCEYADHGTMVNQGLPGHLDGHRRPRSIIGVSRAGSKTSKPRATPVSSQNADLSPSSCRFQIPRPELRRENSLLSAGSWCDVSARDGKESIHIVTPARKHDDSEPVVAEQTTGVSTSVRSAVAMPESRLVSMARTRHYPSDYRDSAPDMWKLADFSIGWISAVPVQSRVQAEKVGQPEKAIKEATDSELPTLIQAQVYLQKCSTNKDFEFWIRSIEQTTKASTPHLRRSLETPPEKLGQASALLHDIIATRPRHVNRGAQLLQQTDIIDVFKWVSSTLQSLQNAEQKFLGARLSSSERHSPLMIAFYDMLMLETAATLKLLTLTGGPATESNRALRRRLVRMLVYSEAQRTRARAPPPPRRKAHTWPPVPPSAGGSFTIYAGEIQRVPERGADRRAWHAWASPTTGGAAPHVAGDADVLRFLRFVALRYAAKHAALSAKGTAALAGV